MTADGCVVCGRYDASETLEFYWYYMSSSQEEPFGFLCAKQDEEGEMSSTCAWNMYRIELDDQTMNPKGWHKMLADMWERNGYSYNDILDYILTESDLDVYFDGDFRIMGIRFDVINEAFRTFKGYMAHRVKTPPFTAHEVVLEGSPMEMYLQAKQFMEGAEEYMKAQGIEVTEHGTGGVHHLLGFRTFGRGEV